MEFSPADNIAKNLNLCNASWLSNIFSFIFKDLKSILANSPTKQDSKVLFFI